MSLTDLDDLSAGEDTEDEEDEDMLDDAFYLYADSEAMFDPEPDPARRRRLYGHLYDLKRKRSRVGRFTRRRRDPRVRRFRRRRRDPMGRHVRHRRRRMDMAMPRFRRRRHDVSGTTPFWSAVLTPALTAVGSVFHNWLYAKGYAKSTLAIPFGMGANVTIAGAGGGLLSSLMAYFGKGQFAPSALSHIGAGMFAEGLNVPAVEQIQRAGVNGGAGMSGGIAEYAILPTVY